MKRTHPVRGYLYIGAATFMWGISATLGRAVFTGRLKFPGGTPAPIDPLILAQSRTTFSFLVLLPILLAQRGAARLRMPRKDLLRCFLLGTLGVAASNYFYYLAIQRTNVATAIILQYTAPLWVLLYMVMRGHQDPTVKRFAAVGLGMLGSTLAIGVGSTGIMLNAVGLAAAMLASFSFAFYNIAGHDVLAHHDRWTVLLYTTLSAALFWMVVNPPWKVAAAHYGAAEWLLLVIFAMLSVLAPFALYFAGLQHLEPTRAVVASCMEPVFSIVIAAIVLGEVMRPMQVLGIAIVLAAILVVQMPEKGHGEELAVVEPIE